MVDFRCSFNGIDLCLNGGVCATDPASNLTLDPQELVCDCPQGWAHDDVFYHFPSCSLPNPTYLAFLIYFSIVVFTLVVFITREFWTITHRKTRSIAFMNIVILTLSWGQTMCCYFQNGAFEGSAVLSSLTFSLTLYMGGKLSVSFMETYFAVKRIPVTKAREALRIASTFAAFVSFALCMAMLATCRGPNGVYNLIVWSNEHWVMLWSAIFCLLVAYYTHLLLRSITQASTLQGASMENRRAVRELVTKIKIIRNASAYNFVALLVLGTPKAIVFLVWGSVPYQWVFGFIILYHGLIVISIGILMFVRHTKSAHRRNPKPNDLPAANNSSRLVNTDPDGVGRFDTKRHKEHGLHRDGKNGRTWLFRGSSLLTKQGQKDMTKMTHDQQVNENQANHLAVSPQLAENGRYVGRGGSSSPRRHLRPEPEEEEPPLGSNFV